MDEARVVRISKYLSKHLRHRPERLGLTLERGGWVSVDALLAACAAHAVAVTPDELREVVARNDKQRFSFDAAGTRIRANQGHSVAIDLELTAQAPPALLYHGTARRNLDAILTNGLHRGGRHHVHLSADVDTAERVGRRHGSPVVLEVAAGRMAADGRDFFRSDNGVWLTDAVPSRYLRPLRAAGPVDGCARVDEAAE